MITEEQVRQALRGVMDPEIGRPIEDIGMLESIAIDGARVEVHVLLTIEGCPLKDRITNDVTAVVSRSRGSSESTCGHPMSQQQREGLVSTLRGGAPPRSRRSSSRRRPR